MEPSELERFESAVLPHLSAAYTLARYLMRNSPDADDVVQEAFLRALKYFGGFRGDETTGARPWLLAIVRNTAYTWHRRRRPEIGAVEFDESLHSDAIGDEHPEAVLEKNQCPRDIGGDARRITAGLSGNPGAAGAGRALLQGDQRRRGGSVGTIMSRLSRARKRLQEALTGSFKER